MLRTLARLLLHRLLCRLDLHDMPHGFRLANVADLGVRGIYTRACRCPWCRTTCIVRKDSPEMEEALAAVERLERERRS
jgi:hypothetical protein